MKTQATLYGDLGRATGLAVEALSKTGLQFRVCRAHDAHGAPTLSMPFGDLHGLERIRAFAEKALLHQDRLDDVFA
jgi:hypothetical protein